MDLSEIPINNFNRHPWETARFKFFRDILLKYAFYSKKSITNRILDVGSGDAWFALQMLEVLPLDTYFTCWDIAYSHTFALPKQRISFVNKIPDGPFQIAFLLDVIEHVENDYLFLKKILAKIDNGGIILFSVPAWKCLMSNHDVLLSHYRRYDPKVAVVLLKKAGLEIQISGGLFHWPLILRILSVLAERSRFFNKPTNHELSWRWGKTLGKIVEKSLRIDNFLSIKAATHGINLPGLSWWALCRKL